MNIIRVMDESLSNKIAAGEVVERPASIVKELVENAIDAGSTKIEVTLEEAGLTTIRVTDNGAGMTSVDAVQAFQRHATSKINTEHDLFRIRTLGFRGEALASIASVSKIEMWTSDGESTGTKVQLEGGKVILHENAAFRKGTDISVSQLFYNTPARLKYMKTIQTELGHTSDLMNRIALSHPKIAFKLSHHSELLLQTSGSGDILRVISDIYGITVARKMISFEAENNDYRVSGYVSLPEMTRASRNYITLLVNGRWVRSFAINKAILDAFHTYLPIGRFPIAVLNIEGDPILTDVNVHPSKQQIRISKEGELLKLIQEGIRQAIGKHRIIPSAIKKESSPSTPSEQVSIWETPQPKSFESKPKSFESKQEWSPPQSKSFEPKQEWNTAQSTIIGTQTEAQPTEKPWTVKEETLQETSQTEQAFESDQKQFPILFPVGQVHGTYIIAQNEDGFFMIDQHAAQERIKYEFFQKQLSKPMTEERQLLLVPLIFHYSSSDKIKIEERLSILEDVGVYLEEFGPTSYAVKEFPSWFPDGEEEGIIEEMIEQILAERQIDIGKIREEAAILMSCKRSIKANHYLNQKDMEVLLADLSQTENPFTCPHGRPVLIHFTTYEIEKMFKRVM